MKRIYRKRRTTRKKFSRRKINRYKSKRFNRSTKVIIRSPQITPDRYLAKLKYQAAFLFSATLLNNQQFRGNSPRDPDVSVGGSQPAGFDQLMALYRNFRVNASKIKIEFVNGATGLTPSVAVIPVNAGAIPSYTRIGQVQEDPYSRSGLMSIAGGSKDRYVTINYMTTKKFFGYKSINQESDFIGDASNDPVLQWYWSIYGSSYTGAAVTIEFRVTITYYSEFFNRISVIDV